MSRTAAGGTTLREGMPLVVIQRELGHSNLGITPVYLQGIDNAEIIDTVHARHAPVIPVARHFGSEQHCGPARRAKRNSRLECCLAWKAARPDGLRVSSEG
jgi:hypothetical protein